MASREEVLAGLTGPGGEFEVVQTQVGGVPMRVYKHAPASLRDMFLGTAAFGDQDFLIYEDRTLTFSEHFKQVAALAAHLKEKGIKKGDRVAIGMRNYPEWVAAFWACQAIGAVTVALNAWWTGGELDYALEDSGTVLLIVDEERLERLKDVPSASRLIEVIVARAEGDIGTATPFEEIVAKGGSLPEAEIAPEDYATILYTSGTTGRPKGAAATHRNHITNIMNTMLNGAVNAGLAGENAPAPPENPGALQTFPFFHIGGLTGLYMATLTGLRLALMHRWSAAKALDLIEEHRLTAAGGVPYVVRQLLEEAEAQGRSLSSLMAMTSGGASVPPDLIRTIGERFARKVAPANGYGLTETTGAVIVNSGEAYLDVPDSVGRPVVTADVRVVDGTRDCADGEIGEIWIGGPNIIPGYWNRPEATEESFGGGWFKTGDLGYRDENGCYRVVDRKKDVIIRGGENIYCAEIEAALLEHPSVRDVAIIGLPDKALGEIVGCVIQQADEEKSEKELEAELTEYLLARLARFKIPARYAMTDEEMPRTATGKLLKRDIRKQFFETE
ncbi:class I adenylate-forming enzyme family protein [Tepidicaulis sp. LMO-SS28]|uniref:class I adenylate-forming enzyme family protein n=1 Tax=Tepidicaulis sp. LMO-SS28 TaxID=3447455 RepID=UPI003EE22688